MSVEDLFATIRREVESGAIGRPVCVRGSFELSADHGRLTRVLARILAEAGRWLGEPPATLFAGGSVAAGLVTALVEGPGGATALVTASVLRQGSPRADVLVLGSRGSLAHDGGTGAGPAADGETGSAENDATGSPLDPRERALLLAIEASLASGDVLRVAPARAGNEER